MERNQLLPEYLKQLRKAHHYRQEDIASHLKVSRQTYSHYETGRIRPSIHVLYKIAKLYKISADEILEHMEAPLTESEEAGGAYGIHSEKEVLACLHTLNEKNRAETLSIMWEIVQAKMVKQEAERIVKEKPVHIESHF